MINKFLMLSISSILFSGLTTVAAENPNLDCAELNGEMAVAALASTTKDEAYYLSIACSKQGLAYVDQANKIKDHKEQARLFRKADRATLFAETFYDYAEYQVERISERDRQNLIHLTEAKLGVMKIRHLLDYGTCD